jgi:hypothetical protein
MIDARLFETNSDRGADAYRATERGFGLTFAAIGFAVGVAKLWQNHPIGWLWLAGAGALLATALMRPRILAPLNRLWGRLALLLHRFVTPVVMLMVFVATVVPMGMIMRAFGKDPLRLRLDPAATTYWIDREPPGPAPGTMKNQF